MGAAVAVGTSCAAQDGDHDSERGLRAYRASAWLRQYQMRLLPIASEDEELAVHLGEFDNEGFAGVLRRNRWRIAG